MKSFFRHMIDSAVVFVAEKYGFGNEEDMLKNELRAMQYEHMLEKTKNMDETAREVSELKNEVKRLTDEKIQLLEYEVGRLQYENQQYKLGYHQPNALEEPILPINQIERFMYKENYIKYITQHGVPQVMPLEEGILLEHLRKECDELTFQIIGNVLSITCLTSKAYEKMEFPLEQFVSMATLRKLNDESKQKKQIIK